MKSRAWMLSTTALALGAGLAIAAPARAADPLQISGKNTCKTAEQHAIPVEGDPDHILLVEKGTCTVSATGQSSRFDGEQFSWVETGDFVKGNGPVQGYFLGNYKDGSTSTSRYTGQIATTVVNGKPHTAFQGTWESTNGTGNLANVHLRGTYKGEALSPTEAVSEWEGIMMEARAQQAQELEGTWKLVMRKLPDGTTQVPPAVLGTYTTHNELQNLNVFWHTPEGKPVSFSRVSTYKMSDADYTETLVFSAMDDGSGKAPVYDLTGKTVSTPVTHQGPRLAFQLPFGEPALVYEGDKLTATLDGEFIDYWERVR